MKQLFSLASLVLLLIILSGCMFPNNELSKNQVPNEDQLESVQNAVDEYRELTNGLVPIKTKENDVDYYEKYLIDFAQVQEAQVMNEAPGTAYESGGLYQYAIIDPENEAQVKLIDLRISEKMREINTKLNIYRMKNQFPPFGEKIGHNMYQLNYKKLGYDKEPTVVSPYSQNNLPFIMNAEGEVFVDYRIDL